MADYPRHPLLQVVGSRGLGMQGPARVPNRLFCHIRPSWQKVSLRHSRLCMGPYPNVLPPSPLMAAYLGHPFPQEVALGMQGFTWTPNQRFLRKNDHCMADYFKRPAKGSPRHAKPCAGHRPRDSVWVL